MAREGDAAGGGTSDPPPHGVSLALLAAPVPAAAVVANLDSAGVVGLTSAAVEARLYLALAATPLPRARRRGSPGSSAAP